MNTAELSNRPTSRLLSLSRHKQGLIIAITLVMVAILHNSIPMPAAIFLMTLTQKLFFVPVILAGFWFGISGGLLTALIASFLFPHYGMAHHQSSIFSMTEGTDIALLFLVGSITGWLRDQLNRELQRHRSTAEERDQALNELKQSYERVQRAERLAALGQMAAGIAHEVRNPLTSMRGAADILQRSLDKQPERAASLIELLQSEISRLDELTRHFLEFARPPEADRHPLPPHALARESIDMMQTQAKDHSLSISGEISDDTSLVSADRDQLRQVILNLLINAIQNADKGSTIKVTSHFTEGYWRLAISNQGPVIPPEQLERIFEPFFTTHAEGTGLGLAVSARIAEAHNGTLECSSTLSATTFTLSLPESHDAAADSDH